MKEQTYKMEDEIDFDPLLQVAPMESLLGLCLLEELQFKISLQN